MKLVTSDPDIQTIVGRIQDGEIDLQPDFQRGSVWNTKKKQLLIDTILRNWHIPPVHIVSQDDALYDEVLDGQQRLAAIYDFCCNKFAIDGALEPHDELIKSLHGCKFSDLSPSVAKKVNRFSIRVLSLTDFDPEEPGELFYRLNHQVTLTPAETRNAYFGEVRDQVREVAREFEGWGLTKQAIGFSNARMAHDDVVARIMCVLDWGHISEKVTANKLADRYRSGPAFPKKVVEITSGAFKSLGDAINSSDYKIKLNKATLWSWVLFVAVFHQLGGERDSKALGNYMAWFEDLRLSMKGLGMEKTAEEVSIVALFNDRAASRVADVSSVVIRDIILWASVKVSPMVNVLNGAPPKLVEHVEDAEQNLKWLLNNDSKLGGGGSYAESEIVDIALKESWGEIS